MTPDPLALLCAKLREIGEAEKINDYVGWYQRSQNLPPVYDALARLVEACGALSHPDGVIRGPLDEGPELNELNEVLAELAAIVEEEK